MKQATANAIYTMVIKSCVRPRYILDDDACIFKPLTEMSRKNEFYHQNNHGIYAEQIAFLVSLRLITFRSAYLSKSHKTQMFIAYTKLLQYVVVYFLRYRGNDSNFFATRFQFQTQLLPNRKMMIYPE